MNETEDQAPPTPKPGILVRAFLIVLPVGLSFMVPLSLWIYYQKKNQPAPATSEFAAMLRRELNAEDFARYARILSQDIGERTMANPENLDAAAAFIESTMGYDNMGYAVQRQAFESKDMTVLNLEAELPGKSKPKELVVVVANYDEADAAGISAIMCVAHALAGSDHARSIRFAAVMSGAGGFGKLRQSVSGEGRKLRTFVLVASTPPLLLGGTPGNGGVRQFQITLADDPPATLARLRDLKKLVEDLADEP